MTVLLSVCLSVCKYRVTCWQPGRGQRASALAATSSALEPPMVLHMASLSRSIQFSLWSGIPFRRRPLMQRSLV